MLNQLDARQLILTGHFELGEKLTEEQMEVVQQARDYNRVKLNGRADIGVFVNDIGFSDKLSSYLINGKDAVIELYIDRIEGCESSACVVAQLPSPSEIESIIDLEVYQLIEEEVGAALLSLCSQKGREGEFHRVVTRSIVPRLILKRLEAYGLPFAQVHRETTMRNVLGSRCKVSKKSKKTWRHHPAYRQVGKSIYVGPKQIRNSSGNYQCVGVCAALYERLCEMYSEVFEATPALQKPAFQSGYALFQELHRYVAHLHNRQFVVRPIDTGG